MGGFACIKYIVVWLFTFAAIGNAYSKSIDSYRCEVYRCYVSSNLNGWQQIITAMELQYSSAKDDSLLLEIIISYYGCIPFLMEKNNNERASAMLDKAFAHLESYLSRYPRNGYALALKSSFYGYRIGIDNYKAAVLGFKSADAINQAMALSPENPWVRMEKANSLLYRPSLFGGNPQEALLMYQKIAKDLKDTIVKCSWNVLNLYINTAFAQIKLKKYDDAMRTYKEILSAAPNCRWVKDVLIPRLQKKMN